LDAKFQMRLACAHTIAVRRPGLLARVHLDHDAYIDVLRACRPEWFS
jgi:hypothetical protein